MTSTKGIALVITSSLMFASYGVWSKLIGGQLGPFYQGWTRGFVLALALLPILLYLKQLKPIPRADWGWLAVFLVFTSSTQAPLFYAYTHMDIGSATLLFFVSLLLTMYVVGFCFLGEKFTGIKLASLLFALFGLYLVFSFSFLTFSLLAACAAVLNGIASGGELSFSKKLSGEYSTLYLSFLSWVAIALTNIPLSLWLGEAQPLPTFSFLWLWVACYALASILGFWFVMEGLKYIEVSVGGLLGLLEIIFSVAFGIFLFNEGLSLKIVIGGLFILIASALPHIHLKSCIQSLK